MDSLPTEVKFSLRTKLLLSIISLLLLIIGVLNLSTVYLLKDDKRAYVYELQATETALAGREVVNMARHALDTLRVALASIDPSQVADSVHLATIKTLLDNQSEISSVSWQSLQPVSNVILPRGQYAKESDVRAIPLAPEDEILNSEKLKAVLPELLKNSFAFVNSSRGGSTPTLGLALADLKLKDNPAGMPVIYAILSLKDLATLFAGKNMTVLTESGSLLYDTDPLNYYGRKSFENDPLFNFSQKISSVSGATEFDLAGSHYLGSVQKLNYNLLTLSRQDYKMAMESVYSLIEKFILIGGMSLSLAVLFAFYFSKSLTAQLRKLFQGTKAVASGNFDLLLDVKSQDEIGALTGSFNVMSKKINQLIQDSVARVRLENELSIASTVQQTLIPRPEFRNQHVNIRSHYQSATECGGDWWGFFEHRGKLSIMIADATGHGLPSALITAAARSCFSVLEKLAVDDAEFSFSPAAMLACANRVIYDASLGQIMMTFFIGVVDFESGTITYCSAGHNPPWLFKREGNTFRLKSLVAVGTRLGETPNLAASEEKSMPIAPGDILFLYTDGLVEGKNQKGDQFGKKRALKLVESSLAGGPDQVVKNIMKDFLDYNQGKALDDDITIAVAEFLPAKPIPPAGNKA